METHVATDAMVLKKQATSINSVVKEGIVLEKFHTKIFYS